MVERMVVWVFVMSGIAVIFDIFDIVMFFAAPDSVMIKATINLLSSLIKWIAFALMLGADVPNYLAEVYAAKCYNAAGQQLVSATQDTATLFIILQVMSAIFSLILSPISGYYGGKFTGIPYVK